MDSRAKERLWWAKKAGRPHITLRKHNARGFEWWILMPKVSRQGRPPGRLDVCQQWWQGMEGGAQSERNMIRLGFDGY